MAGVFEPPPNNADVLLPNTKKMNLPWFNWFNKVYLLLSFIKFGSGNPNNVVTADTGSIYLNTAGGAGTTLYVKETSPTGDTGWVAK